MKKPFLSTPRRSLIAFVFSAILGIVAITAPVLLGSDAKLPAAPISGVVRAAVEHAGVLTLVGLLIAGAIVRYLVAAPVVLIGLGTVAVLPLLAIAEMFVDPTSHNLWPFEFVFYGIGSIPGILGALLGQCLSPRPYPEPGAHSSSRLG